MADSGGLPHELTLSAPYSWDLWVLWRSTDRRFLPSQLMQEDYNLLSDMIQLDSVFEKMKESYAKKDD